MVFDRASRWKPPSMYLFDQYAEGRGQIARSDMTATATTGCLYCSYPPFRSQMESKPQFTTLKYSENGDAKVLKSTNDPTSYNRKLHVACDGCHIKK
ncbi:hypothetical protein E4U13_005324, partial [Claviceps humidiphila]